LIIVVTALFGARETYLVRSPDEFEEIFELAEPDKPFDVYSHARFRRTAAR
jgi:hypothetical protein